MPRTPVSFITSLAFGLLAVAAATAGATPVTQCDTVTPTLGTHGTATVICQRADSGQRADTITVPAGTVRIDVTVRGGGGAAGGLSENRGYDGGSGARVGASVTPTTPRLTVAVGVGGQPGSVGPDPPKGGGGGGYVDTASRLVCDPGDVAATADGSGGGAGGSYVKPQRLIGVATYDNSGGTAGGRVDGGWTAAGLDGDVTLTFVGATYTVTYDGNGATGGPVPTDHWGPYLDGYIVTVCDNHRTDLSCDFPNGDPLTRDGFTFDGWNTAANGSGASYAPTNTFAITGNTVLYAQWKAPAATTSPSTPAAPPATPVATPAASAPAITSPPALRGAAVRCSGAACTTSGTLPAGATRVSQIATSGARTLSRELAWATAATAKGTCKVKTRGKRKAATRTYTCRIRLTKGTWTVTTKALAPTSAVMAQAVKVARVK